MKKSIMILGTLLIFLFILQAADKPADYDDYWPQWRGPLVNGVAPNGNPPLVWSEDQNITWKVDIPGKGHATPIIWKDRIYLATAVDTGKSGRSAEEGGGRSRGRSTSNIHKFIVLAVERGSGEILWQKTVKEEMPQEATHDLGSWASNSPITDGEHLYAYFGSRGIYCLDLEGKLKWEKDFGQMSKRNSFGEGASPALYGDKLIITWDHEEDSFIIALDKKTGKTIWKVERDESSTWVTPYVIEFAGKRQVITPGTKRIRSYDLETGNLIWECGGLTSNPIPMPVKIDDTVIVMTGHRGFSLLAIDLKKAKGDITGTGAIVWSLDKDTPYTPAPLLVGNRLYFLKSNNGILSCYDAKTGGEFYSAQRLEGLGNLYTSPVAAKDRVYILGQKGLTYVVKEGTQFEVLAKNQLGGEFHSSPAIVGKTMYIRSFTHLYCIEEK
ncbi:PQQ-binding-like beta-propeller repeat protein [Acidobacteriota bacterium]